VHERDYRPDIDGLRAVAVVCVVLFHADLGPFTGGFIGVDVFFVISGFLITRIIVDEVSSTGRFNLARFYVRRARRILPALFFTIALSAIFAFLLFSPEQFARFGRSMSSSAASVSNVFFWQESGYFDADAASKPLLHTWSLGVEEQFYALWPIILVVALRKSGKPAAAICIAIAGIASFGLNAWFLDGRAILTITRFLPSTEAPAAAFFLMPFRIFEFALGGLLVWSYKLPPARPIVSEAALVAGLALIGYAVVTFTAETRFPYFNALIPCAGAALAIYGGLAPIGGLLLRNPVTVGLGLVSYSVYLLHWPVFVFYRQLTFSPLSDAEAAILCAIIVPAAGLMYKFVEQPFRRRWRADVSWDPRAVAVVAIGAAVALIIPGAAVWQGDGWSWRIPAERFTKSNSEWRRAEAESYCKRWDRSKPRDLFSCQNYRGADRDIIVWGDSHAIHLIAGLSEAYPAFNIYALHRLDCISQSGFAGYVRSLADKDRTAECIDFNARALRFLAGYKPANVILTNAKRDNPAQIAPPTEYLLRELRAEGHHAFVLGDFIRPAVDINACRNVPDWILPDEVLAERCEGDAATATREIAYNRDLSGLLGDDFIDPTAVQCAAGRCPYVEGSMPLYRDTHHLNIPGSILMIERLKSILPIIEMSAAQG
jgi:peptidoglycan/LPS O-acetylase OafA/YrhL